MSNPTFLNCKCYGGIIKSQNTGKYLLVKGITGKWSFPKGHIELNETPYECAKREIYEETGLIIENINLMNIIFVSLYYYFDITLETEFDTSPKDLNEIKDIKWFLPEETVNIKKNQDVNRFFHKLLKANKIF